MRNSVLNGAVPLALIGAIAVSACGTSTGTGAAIGGLGAGLLTGSVQTAALGAAVGAGVGYLSEQEKERERARIAEEQQRLRESRITDNPETAYRPEPDNPFTGTTWRVISMEGVSEYKDFSQIVVTFQTNTKATTMYTSRSGESEAWVENYGVVGDVLVLQGVDKGEEYTIAAKFARNERLMSLTFADLTVVLEEVEGA